VGIFVTKSFTASNSKNGIKIMPKRKQAAKKRAKKSRWSTAVFVSNADVH
jgi:hypothetical protein